MRVPTVILLIVLTATPASAQPRSIVKHYVGAPLSAGVVFCGNPRPAVDGVGRICALIGEDDSSLDILITDVAGSAVAGRYLFFGLQTGTGEPPDIVGSGTFCRSATGVSIPDEATHMDVEIGDQVDEPNGACGTLTAGTYGAVALQFL